MTKKQKQYFIDRLIAPLSIDDENCCNSKLGRDYMMYHNSLIEQPEYIAAVNAVVDLLDQYGNIGQVEDIIYIMLNDVIKEAIRLINI